MFPKESDPKGDPDTWTHEEMRRWLSAVSDNLKTDLGLPDLVWIPFFFI